MRHNSLRDSIANCMREVCYDVRIEPTLLPVNCNDFSCSANTAEEARLDISARGVKSAFERTYYDVRVTHPYASSNVTLTLDKLYEKHEAEKERFYGERVRQVEKGSFDPLVFSTTGGMGPQATNFLKRLAHLIADKRGERYADVMGFLRTKLRFSLLRSVLIAVRGERGRPSSKEPFMGLVPFNLIPDKDSYDI